MRFSALAALILLLPAYGCREAIVDPLPEDGRPGSSEEVPPDVETGEFYLKGPATMAYGQRSIFRSEPLTGATRFAWFFDGEPLLEVESPTSRATYMTARDYGTVIVRVVHYDEQDQVLGEGRTRVSVVVQ